MGLWSIVVPEETENLIAYPSFEGASATGWTAIGGSVVVSSAQARRGLQSGIVAPGAGLSNGAYYQLGVTSGKAYTFSIDFLGVLDVPYKVWFADTSGNLLGLPKTFIGTGLWARQFVTWLSTVTGDIRLCATKNAHASTDPFYLDGAQCEAKAYWTTYCDGSARPYAGFRSSGCSWEGVAHASKSLRSALSRAGGRVMNLETDLGFFINDDLGTGAPPVENYLSAYANPGVAGAMHQNTRETARTITLLGTMYGDTMDDLRIKKRTLEQVTQPNLTVDSEPFWLQYLSPSCPLEIACRYDGGLEGGAKAGFSERITLRLLAPHPYWRSVLT